MGSRRLAAWLSSLPLMVVGSQVAHVLAYRWVFPNAHVRLSALLVSGHGYMVGSAYLPMLLGVVGAVEVVAVGWLCAGSVRRSLQRPVPAWAFALLPIIGFTLQELIERLLAGAPDPWLIVLQPTFRVGLLIQLPFALASYLVARILLSAARQLGVALRPVAVMGPSLAGDAISWIVLEAPAPRLAARAGRHSGRGPPRLAPAAVAVGR